MATGEEEKGFSLADQYKIREKDEDSKQWACLLDFESPIKVESDWYATETFQVFLDALDINQPTSLGGGKRNLASNCYSSLTINSSNKSLDKTSDTDQQQQTKESISSQATKDKIKATGKPSNGPDRQKQQNFETILSAEALKILSEFPDLSHMSATRSFIFPAATSKTKNTAKR